MIEPAQQGLQLRAHGDMVARGKAESGDEGEPGERMPTFYGGYVRDLDGNKLCFFQMG